MSTRLLNPDDADDSDSSDTSTDSPVKIPRRSATVSPSTRSLLREHRRLMTYHSYSFYVRLTTGLTQMSSDDTMFPTATGHTSSTIHETESTRSSLAAINFKINSNPNRKENV
ncbi:hypothetical protein NECAME_17570 [Necator americanus]|uniref:Uncharacterized protein n=1 Tax=Necator americanus TaxID=51031 RepID=W2TLY3_NECAM|nr:hypothetical protein NECAME_17570 [Necator americanus]ETN83125.1 hypothetical protein NECAME_17570 [Necator americanus]